MGPRLLASATKLLARLLSDGGLELVQVPPLPARGGDATWEIRAGNDRCTVLVQVFTRFIPREVDRVLGVSRRLPSETMMVVAPWLSPHSRAMLREHGFNYLDLTGNVWLRIARPTVYLHLDGAQRDPDPPAKRPVQLRGSGINALVRTLVDFAPPYRQVDLAAVSGLSKGYVSRVVETLDGERLIQRDPKSKTITDVDWPGLLAVRAENYSLLDSNPRRAYLARSGPTALLRQLDDQVIVTGSFAIQDHVRVAAPMQLILYVPNADDFARRHALMPADSGANVVLLQAADSSQLLRPRRADDGTLHAGLSQLVQDCLSGNGRLPEEGSALLDWMIDNPSQWRGTRLPV